MATRVKICGIKDAAIMAAALAGGADDVGLVFFPKSPRHVRLEEAADLADRARGQARIVALTVDADDEQLAAIVSALRPDVLQLHGRESPDRCRAIASRWQVPLMKAIGVATISDVTSARAYAPVVDQILFDAKPPQSADLPGGNGVAFDWAILEPLGNDGGRAVPQGRIPFMLSGGLTPHNVGDAILASGALAVDVSSGVETGPGIKSAALIRQFIAAAKAARR